MGRIRSTLIAFVAVAGIGARCAEAGEPLGPIIWTGFYAGLQGGYGWSSSRYSDDTYLSEANPDGLIGGAYIGYNRQLSNRFVLGVEADILAAGMKGTDGQRYLSDPHTAIPNVGLDLDFKWNGAIRARLGYATGRYLPYIAGGVSFGGYQLRMEDYANGTVPFIHNEVRAGWNIGAGIDYVASDRILLRAEYRFTDFGTDHFPNSYSGPYSQIELQTHDVRLGVAMRF